MRWIGVVLSLGIVVPRLVFAAEVPVTVLELHRGALEPDRPFIEGYVMGAGMAIAGPEGVPDRTFVGRYDLEGDGHAELLVRVQADDQCGEFGCETVIFRRFGGQWRFLSSLLVTGGGDAERVPVFALNLPGRIYPTLFSTFDGIQAAENYEYWSDEVYVGVCLPVGSRRCLDAPAYDRGDWDVFGRRKPEIRLWLNAIRLQRECDGEWIPGYFPELRGEGC